MDYTAKLERLQQLDTLLQQLRKAEEDDASRLSRQVRELYGEVADAFETWPESSAQRSRGSVDRRRTSRTTLKLATYPAGRCIVLGATASC